VKEKTPATTEYLTLPISKPTRVIFEAVRTISSVAAVVINTIVLLRVFGLI
jgi:hypothetical protein